MDGTAQDSFFRSGNEVFEKKKSREKMCPQRCVPNADSSQPRQSDQNLRSPHEESLHIWLSKINK